MNKRNVLMQSIYSQNADVICISEVLPKNVSIPVTNAEIKIPGYHCFNNLESKFCHRGVLIHVKDTLDATSFELSTDFAECTGCEVKFENENKNLMIFCVYRSPNNSDENDIKLNEFLQHLYRFGNKNLIITGDFNYPEIDWPNGDIPRNSEHKATKFFMNVQSALLFQKVTDFTHYRPNQNPTLIDLVLINNDNIISDIDHLAPLGKSDHQVLKFSFN